jgi:hypothetical protein
MRKVIASDCMTASCQPGRQIPDSFNTARVTGIDEQNSLTEELEW